MAIDYGKYLLWALGGASVGYVALRNVKPIKRLGSWKGPAAAAGAGVAAGVIGKMIYDKYTTPAPVAAPAQQPLQGVPRRALPQGMGDYVDLDDVMATPVSPIAPSPRRPANAFEAKIQAEAEAEQLAREDLGGYNSGYDLDELMGEMDSMDRGGNGKI